MNQKYEELTEVTEVPYEYYEVRIPRSLTKELEEAVEKFLKEHGYKDER